VGSTAPRGRCKGAWRNAEDIQEQVADAPRVASFDGSTALAVRKLTVTGGTTFPKCGIRNIPEAKA